MKRTAEKGRSKEKWEIGRDDQGHLSRCEGCNKGRRRRREILFRHLGALEKEAGIQQAEETERDGVTHRRYLGPSCEKEK